MAGHAHNRGRFIYIGAVFKTGGYRTFSLHNGQAQVKFGGRVL